MSFSALIMFWGCNEATVAQQAEQLICNQRVGGSIPFGGSRERFPSGQREQTVNLPAQPSEVRILPSPPYKLCVAKFSKLTHIVCHSSLSGSPGDSLRREFSDLLGFLKKGAGPSKRTAGEQTSVTSWVKRFVTLLGSKMCGSSSVVERQPSKLRVAGSNPVSRSMCPCSSVGRAHPW